MTSKNRNSRFFKIKHAVPDSVTFGLYSSEQIRKLSAVKIVTPVTLDILGNPVPGGLYDSLLGPTKDKDDVCKTCYENYFQCPGHMGHIELPLSTINPLFHNTIFQILRITCFNCFNLRIPVQYKLLLLTQTLLLDNGCALEAQEAAAILSNTFSSDANTDLSQEAAQVLAQSLLDEYVQSLGKDTEDREWKHKFYSKSVLALRRNFVDAVLKTIIKGKCLRCKSVSPKLKFFQNRIMSSSLKVATINTSDDTPVREVVSSPTYMTPQEVRNALSRVCSEDMKVLQELFPILKHAPAGDPSGIFFIDAVAVSPPKSRPANYVNGQVLDHLQTHTYRDVVQKCLVLRNIIQAVKDDSTDNLPNEGKGIVAQMHGDTLKEKLHIAWQELQTSIDHLLDNEMGHTTGGRMGQGIKQLIEKKEGLFRMHMMGKRVNFAARSVITPDPNICVDEIGIPEAFAKKLTYPVAVTAWNVAELRNMVLNGPDIHPGAIKVESENGTSIYLSADSVEQREGLAKRLLTPIEKSPEFFKGLKTVHRHLCNGDVLLLNRQPTLHKPSIMAHKARVLKGEKTIRLHYANCKAYNADFDGDEMNAHFPQSELARSEAYNLVNVCNQYLVPKDGTPLSGLIQDHVISGVKLTMRGRFFERGDYCQYVYEALYFVSKPIKLLPPAMLKPAPMWSGKQIISTILINLIPEKRSLINLESKGKISIKAWVVCKPRPWKVGVPFTDPNTMSEAEVIIRQGELLCGVLDKTHYGATSYGLIHCFYELYGGTCSSQLLSAFSRLFTGFLQREGFSLGVEDILVVPTADKERTKVIKNLREAGDLAAAGGLGLKYFTNRELLDTLEEAYSSSDPKKKANIDRHYKSTLDKFTSDINRTCMPFGLLKRFPSNNLQLMVQSGAKGSTVNTMQISCALGQIELEGKRPPLMISGRALPSFRPYDTSPRAGGYVDGRFMTGIRPQEFFFHCMAGREGLIDTAVKTSRSGYLQRCLVKHLEGLVINYDMTVRDSDGSVIQFLYGEDGLDVCKSPFLKENQLHILVENSQGILNKHKLSVLKNSSDIHCIEKAKSSIRKWKKKNGNPLQKKRVSAFNKYSASVADALSGYGDACRSETGRSERTDAIINMWRQSNDKERKSFRKMSTKCPDPVIATFRPACDFGVLSERLEAIMDNYLKGENSATVCSDDGDQQVTQITKTQFEDLMSLKSIESLSPAGEPVGLLAAQSIGEPSTQMTLNTFHFAGRGDMNVTLGIPRLREILMVASKTIKTPSSDIPFLPHVLENSKESEGLKMKLSRVTLSDVLEYVRVNEEIEEKGTFWYLKYEIKFKFLPYGAYKHQFSVKPQGILHYMETKFFKSVLMSEYKRQCNIKDVDMIERATTTEVEGQASEDKNTDENNEEETRDSETRDPVETVEKMTIKEEAHISSDEEPEVDDEDATMARRRQRHEETREYEEPEKEEVTTELNEDDGFEEMEEETVNTVANGTIVKERDDSSDESSDKDMEYEHSDMVSEKQRKEDVVRLHHCFEDYEYDTKHEHWCKLTFSMPLAQKAVDMSNLVKDCAEKAIIHEIPGIRRAFTYINPETNHLTLKTDGHNLEEMVYYEDLLDLNKIYSNDISRMAEIYGIEAARNVLVKEIQDVFKVYGITVNPRHLLLVADYMTYDGTYKPCNRIGMGSCVSPLQQMSFETSLQYLKRATLEGSTDKLQSPSSRIVVGLPCRSGTGILDVVQDIRLYKQYLLLAGKN